MPTMSEQAWGSCYPLLPALPHQLLKVNVLPFLKLNGAEAVLILQRKWHRRRFRKLLARFKRFDVSRQIDAGALLYEHYEPVLMLKRARRLRNISRLMVIRALDEHARRVCRSDIPYLPYLDPNPKPSEGGSVNCLNLNSPICVLL